METLLTNCVYVKIFHGGRGGDTFKTPSPYNNFFLYPPLFIMFLKNPVMTPHLPTSSIFHCYHPLPLPPLKSLIIHFHVHCSKVFTKIFSKILSVGSSCRYHPLQMVIQVVFFLFCAMLLHQDNCATTRQLHKPCIWCKIYFSCCKISALLLLLHILTLLMPRAKPSLVSRV